MEKKQIEVGQIVGVHGIAGEVKIQHWCDAPEVFLGLKTVWFCGKEHKLVAARTHKNIILARISEVDDRTTAEGLRLCVLTADRDQLPPLSDGQFYICDLIGITVITDENRVLGKLSDVLETGSNQVYEVTDPDKKKYYLPVIDDVVLNTDLENGTMLVHLLEGLIDE